MGYDNKSDELIGICRILKILLSIKELENFDDKETFQGYKYLISCAMNILLSYILMEHKLPIKKDFTYGRASYRRVSIDKIPDTCDAIILIRNYKFYLNKLERCNDFNELEVFSDTFQKEILNIFDKIFINHIQLNYEYKISQEEAERISSIFILNLNFHQLQNIRPSLSVCEFYDEIFKINKSKLKKSFNGYKKGLVFIWQKLLKKKKDLEIINGINNTISWNEDYLYENFVLKGKTISERNDLDMYFRIIQENIINKFEKKFKLRSGIDNFFEFKNKINRSEIKPLIKKIKQVELKEKIDILNYYLYWNKNIEILNSKRSGLFHGSPTLERIIIGSCEASKKFSDSYRIKMIKFIHQNEIGNDYSYGVLIESYGTFFSDFSGWLIFYDVCGDYSGFSGSEYVQIEHYINYYKKRNLIEIKDIHLSFKEFKKYMKLNDGNKRGIVKDDKLFRVKVRKLSGLFQNSKGIMLELLSYIHIKATKIEKIDFDLTLYDSQIDIVYKIKNEIHFVECKTSIPTINKEKESKKIKEKSKLFIKNKEFSRNWKINEKTEIKYEFWTWKKDYDSSEIFFIKEGISLISIQEEMTKNSFWINKNKKNIKSIFESNEIFTL